ncbi:hypothetical protein KUTeg_020765 [Tegillarca granosa]|uniref:UspA domain-containing protein n=1 Tax=Tegillarca granosa TaxID=220873 RepID=A0ABQ9E8W0_TEGGR|nr:hypothetical protein KUTeg_020765 [Tegillarca granosa]
MAAQQTESQKGRVILIPVDASEEAQNAFCCNSKSSATAESIVSAFAHFSVSFTASPKQLKDELENTINENVRALEKKYAELVVKKGVTSPKPIFKTKAGNPKEQIMKLAEELNPSFIVCGSRGLGTFRRTVLGSFSEFLLHHSHAPVLIYLKPCYGALILALYRSIYNTEVLRFKTLITTRWSKGPLELFILFGPDSVVDTETECKGTGSKLGDFFVDLNLNPILTGVEVTDNELSQKDVVSGTLSASSIAWSSLNQTFSTSCIGTRGRTAAQQTNLLTSSFSLYGICNPQA